MASKKQIAPHDPGSFKPLKVGSRVRCTDDGVGGRIVWANATSVKVRWDDGEQVTWRRDSLAERQVEVLDPPAAEPAPLPDEPVQPTAPAATGQATTEALPAGGAGLPAAEPTPPAEAPAAEPPAGEPSRAEKTPKGKEPRGRKGARA